MTVKEPRVDELGEMLARRRAGDMREIGEFAAGQRPAIHQGCKNGGARCVTDERRNLDQICGGDHARYYRRGAGSGKRRQFGARRSNGSATDVYRAAMLRSISDATGQRT